jgi:hypothetical protein
VAPGGEVPALKGGAPPARDVVVDVIVVVVVDDRGRPWTSSSVVVVCTTHDQGHDVRDLTHGGQSSTSTVVHVHDHVHVDDYVSRRCGTTFSAGVIRAHGEMSLEISP